MSRRVIIFGTGGGARRVLAGLGPDQQVVAVLDNNPAKHGHFFHGYRIQPSSVIKSLEYDAIIVASMYYDAIAQSLMALQVPSARIERGIIEMQQAEQPLRDLGSFQPLVSVITPAWNRAGSIARAVRSVLDQTYRNLELLLVDDGSRDDTVEAAQAAAGGDVRLRLIRNPHLGVSPTRNTGLRLARGEWIAYLDSDNRWHEEYLARMLAWFATGRYQIGYCGSNVFDNERGQCYLRFSQYDRLRLESENYIDLNVLMHHRSFIDRYGPFDEALTRLVDWDLVLRYTAEHAPFTIKAALVDYYVQPGLPRISTSESFDANFRIMKERARLTTTVFSGQVAG